MLKQVVCLLIRLYQLLLSPFLGGQCRFEPSCSRYALVAVERFGAGRGSWLALKRLSQCHPFCAHHGYDPPPEIEHSSRVETLGARKRRHTLLDPLSPSGLPSAPAENG